MSYLGERRAAGAFLGLARSTSGHGSRVQWDLGAEFSGIWERLGTVEQVHAWQSSASLGPAGELKGVLDCCPSHFGMIKEL